VHAYRANDGNQLGVGRPGRTRILLNKTSDENKEFKGTCSREMWVKLVCKKPVQRTANLRLHTIWKFLIIKVLWMVNCLFFEVKSIPLFAFCPGWIDLRSATEKIKNNIQVNRFKHLLSGGPITGDPRKKARCSARFTIGAGN
jgi:hypothetical protein